MKATVLVRPKPGILDPQGQAVESSLRELGFRVAEARVGRVVDLELEGDDPAAARAQLERAIAVDVLVVPGRCLCRRREDGLG